MKALVLSGGSIKGAFQAGAVRAALNLGFVPHYVWGVSVGALNGAFLADRAGRAAKRGQEPDWPIIGEDLKFFWLNNIQRPSDVVRKRGSATIAWKTILGRFDGLLDTKRLKELVERTIKTTNLRASPIEFNAGVVNLASGEFLNADASFPNFLKYVVASSAIPVLMPLVEINKAPLGDGGIRDIAPLRHAIHAGASEILVVMTQAKKLEAVQFNTRNLFSLSERVIAILTDEIVQNDVDRTMMINRFCPADGRPASSGPFIGKRRVDIKVIRPRVNPELNLLDFDSRQIAELIAVGEKAATDQLRRGILA